MYGKIFGSIYDGTLAEDWRALITFQQFIVLCDADGILDMTPQSISRRTGIPIEHIKAGIEVLEKTDKYSRTPDQNGCRIELIDEHRPWGWHIVNHEKYKKMQDSDTIRAQTRARVQRHRSLKKGVTDGNGTVTDSNVQKRHIDTDTNTDTNTRSKEGETKSKQGRFAPPTLAQVTEYVKDRGNLINPSNFMDFYETNGWMQGSKKIKSWKACVRTWESREKSKPIEQKQDWI